MLREEMCMGVCGSGGSEITTRAQAATNAVLPVLPTQSITNAQCAMGCGTVGLNMLDVMHFNDNMYFVFQLAIEITFLVPLTLIPRRGF